MNQTFRLPASYTLAQVINPPALMETVLDLVQAATGLNPERPMRRQDADASFMLTHGTGPLQGSEAVQGSGTLQLHVMDHRNEASAYAQVNASTATERTMLMLIWLAQTLDPAGRDDLAQLLLAHAQPLFRSAPPETDRAADRSASATLELPGAGNGHLLLKQQGLYLRTHRNA